MVWLVLESKLSTPRMSRYLQACQGNRELAAQAYVHNMRLAESLVSIFHVLEVALRNGIQKEMTFASCRDDWYESWERSHNVGLRSLHAKVSVAKQALARRGGGLVPGKIIAELSFGFWTSMFNRVTIRDLSKPLMKVFFHCPKAIRQPDLFRTRLNAARDLRNRCFHHEPLLWKPLSELHREILEMIGWIDPVLAIWLRDHDQFPSAFCAWKGWRQNARLLG